MDQHRLADNDRALRNVFLRNLILQASIGVHAHEQVESQRVRINIDLGVDDDSARDADDGIGRDELARVVDYEKVADGVRALLAGGHVRLVETLAERIAAFCLLDIRVMRVRVRVEKLDILPDAESAGVEIERVRRI